MQTILFNLLCGFEFPLQVSLGGLKFDLMIVDFPAGLPIPNVSKPYIVIPEWNLHSSSHIKALFEFASAYLYEDACLLVFLP